MGGAAGGGAPVARVTARAEAMPRINLPEDRRNKISLCALLAITCFLTGACALTVLEIVGWHLDWALPAVRAASRLALMLAAMVLLGWHLREEYKQLFLRPVLLRPVLLRPVLLRPMRPLMILLHTYMSGSEHSGVSCLLGC
jgi:uncharacterized membrane protein YqjE